MAEGEGSPTWGQLVAGPALALRVSRDGGRTWEPYVMPRPGRASEPVTECPCPRREGEEV